MPHNISTPQYSDNLARKASLLRDATVFVGTSDDYPLSEKQQIFLALAGCKPVSEATAAHMVTTASGSQSPQPDSQAAIAALLSELGLTYRLRSDAFATDALVSTRQEFLADYDAAEARGDTAAIGQLFGYPRSATAAFGEAGALLPAGDDDDLIAAAGISPYLPGFRLTREHWQEEIEVLRSWEQLLTKYGLNQPLD